MQECIAELHGSPIAECPAAAHSDGTSPEHTMQDRPTVLVLGAHGRFGGAAVQAFAAAGWRVLAQARRAPSSRAASVEPLAIPLADTDALVRAAAGARAVVYAVNPIYTRWDTEMLPLARLGMDVAQRLGATFLLPGNVYGHGESMPARLDEQTPERPSTTKGRLRVQLEAELAERAASGLRSVVIRAGDFYGHGQGSWIDLLIAKRLAAGRLTYPGPLDVPHAWAYLPDLARAFVSVSARDDLPPHVRLHFEGHTLTGTQLLDTIEAAARDLGIAGPLKRGRMAWWPLRIAGVAVPMLRELVRMSYLWRVPHALDGSRLRALVGPLPATPPPEAMRQALLELRHGGRAVGMAPPLPSPGR
jgi:nucleoside-diphosphate-sugar epimerase